MADNVAITAGSGTSVAADDISSVFYQRVKLSLGADGTAVDAVAGAGNVGTGVQRVTLAADDPAVALLGAAATSVPHEALDTTSDLSVDNKSRSGAGETTMVTATASQTTRLHAYAVTVPGAGTVEIRDGASGTVLRKHIFGALGGLVRDFRARPYAKTTANTALMFYWSGSGEANIDFDYVKSA